jgi:hypothetical protein
MPAAFYNAALADLPSLLIILVLMHNFDKMVHAPGKDRLEGDALAAEEEHILRCLGAAVIIHG